MQKIFTTNFNLLVVKINEQAACGSGAVQPGKVGAYDDIVYLLW